MNTATQNTRRAELNLLVHIFVEALARHSVFDSGAFVTCTGTRACNKRDFEHEPRVPARQPDCFSVDERSAALLFRKQPAPIILTTDQSQTAPALRALRRTQDLSPGQRSIMELMRAHQFGRIENMPVRAGEPLFDSDVKVVRIVRLGGESDPSKLTNAEHFELKRQVRDLFDELARLENGMVIRLEFRHGLPFLIEMTPRLNRASEL